MDNYLYCDGLISVHNPKKDENKAVNASGRLLFYRESCDAWTMEVRLRNYLPRKYCLNKFTMMILPNDFEAKCLSGCFTIRLCHSDVVKFRGSREDYDYAQLLKISHTLLSIRDGKTINVSDEWEESTSEFSEKWDEEEMEKDTVDSRSDNIWDSVDEAAISSNKDSSENEKESEEQNEGIYNITNGFADQEAIDKYEEDSSENEKEAEESEEQIEDIHGVTGDLNVDNNVEDENIEETEESEDNHSVTHDLDDDNVENKNSEENLLSEKSIIYED